MASIDVLARIANTSHTTLDYLILGDEIEDDSPLTRQFVELCKCYPEERMRRGLALLEYYLKLEDS